MRVKVEHFIDSAKSTDVEIGSVAVEHVRMESLPVKFPIKNKDELDALETMLRSDPAFRKNLVSSSEL